MLPEDEDLVHANGLTDAWKQVHLDDSGYTWGVYGEQAFPPGRLDKVAVLGFKPEGMGILETKEVQRKVGISEELGVKVQFSNPFVVWCEDGWEEGRVQRARVQEERGREERVQEDECRMS